MADAFRRGGDVSADTEPGGMRHDTTEDDTVADTTEPSRPALAYEVAAGDDDVDSLLGRMAPARVAPPVGEVAETNGHDAAKFRGEARIPPRAHPTASPQPPVILDITPAKPVEPVEQDTLRTAAALETTVGPSRNKPRLWMLLLALGGGSVVAAVVVVAMTRPAAYAPTSASATGSVPSSALSVGARGADVTASVGTTASTASPPPPAPRSAMASSSARAASSDSLPSSRSTPIERAPKASPSNTSAPPAQSALPPDIKWSLD